MKRKILACLAAVSMMMITLGGCKSTLRAGIESSIEQNTVTELDLDGSYDAEGGYHFQRIPWGSTGNEANRALYGEVESVSSYGDDGSVVYSVDTVNVTVRGRQCDASTLTISAAGDASMFSIVFDSSELKDTMEKQSELFDGYFETLKEKFGEPTDERNETSTVSDTVDAAFHTYYWDYTTPDGKETQLQWSEACLNGNEEPNYVSLGFVWLNPPEKEK